MPTIKRSEWLKLSPKDKLLHRAQRLIDGLQKAQNDYRHDQLTAKVATQRPSSELSSQFLYQSATFVHGEKIYPYQ